MTPSQAESSPIEDLLVALRRHLAIILVCAVGVPAVAVAYSLVQPKEYSASSILVFRQPNFSQDIAGQPIFSPSVDPTIDAATNFGLVALPQVALQTAQALHISPSLVSGHISVQPEGTSNLLTVTATERDPQLAVRVAAELSRQYIAGQQAADQALVEQAVARLSQRLHSLPPGVRRGPTGRQLVTAMDQLTTLAAVQTGNAQIAQNPLLPTAPSSPRPVRSGVLGLVAGILLGLVLALLVTRLDQRLRTPQDVVDAYRTPLLAAIPRDRSVGQLRERDKQRASSQLRDAFSLLRTNLQFLNHHGDFKSILITSAVSGEGKTTVASNLSQALASAGARVLLVDADLRRPNVRQQFNLPEGPGLSNFLAGENLPSWQELETSIPGLTGSDESQRPRLHVLTAGDRPPNPADLLSSPRLSKLLEPARQQFDVVIIDSAPIALVPDAVSLAAQVDAVLLVARPGSCKRRVAARVRSQLERIGSNPVGVVANAVSPSDDYYGYGVGYGYDDPADRGDLKPAQPSSSPLGAQADPVLPPSV
jgi:succinoglycan biosynthesis transport protein ExoP